ncbi:tripartite motif-containing protein 10-like [Gopherus flavomarginatus]|uniref:tripartite motif-containing protein 10-like n=1 Tax=Gopherus flavomarginatus TaxID=286002 RepID=UPI0021CBD03E|nr:tripartite motif-containing protein 10-like [Gopherus flavomarginatus]
MAGAGGSARRLLRPRRQRGGEEALGEHLACQRKAEEERQSAELLKQTEAERQKIVAEWKELRGFLEEQEQLLLSQLEELARAIVRRRDEGVSRPSGEISLIREEGQQQSRSQTPQVRLAYGSANTLLLSSSPQRASQGEVRDIIPVVQRGK